ncbi:MAG: hypothetical protein IPM82_06525 [Saprospiraceae bacterium]|nr:hypothetical protein [Saprospiraceae bacterium]
MRQNILKGFIFFAFFFLGKNLATAQTDLPAKLTWGPDNNEPGNTVATKVIGIAPDGFYVLRQKCFATRTPSPRFGSSSSIGT